MCTNFRLQADDGTIVVGRSLEFDLDLHPRFTTLHAGQSYASHAPKQPASQAPEHPKGLQWIAKYNALVIGILGENWYFDGMNDQGLVVEGLWLPHYTQYQDVQAAANPTQALTNLDFISWCLTNFMTVAEVVTALQNNAAWVWGPTIPQLDGIAPLHYALHDHTGSQTSCMTIEYMNGASMMYENPIGVLTNAPPFEWHQMNLNNYLNLQASTPSPKTFATIELNPPGVGGGFLGMPGDWTPPSRFVRVANMCHYVQPVPDARSVITLAEHLLNTVDIPKGDIVTPSSPRSSQMNVEYTQFACIWDLTHHILYYRTYDDLMLRSIDVNQLKLMQTNQPAYFPLTLNGHSPIDITPSLLSQ